MIEPEPDCVVLGLGDVVGVRHGGDGVVAGVLVVEDVVNGDGLVRPVAGSGVDLGTSNSGLKFGAAAASVADLQQTAGAAWNRLPAVQRLDCRLHTIPY